MIRTGTNGHGRKSRGETMEEQTQQVFKNTEGILKEYAGTGKDIIKLGIFTTDIKKTPEFRKVRDL